MGKRQIIVRDPRPPRTRLLAVVLAVVVVVVVLGFVLFRMRAA